jgi:hypothetical protein
MEVELEIWSAVALSAWWGELLEMGSVDWLDALRLALVSVSRAPLNYLA